MVDRLYLDFGHLRPRRSLDPFCLGQLLWQGNCFRGSQRRQLACRRGKPFPNNLLKYMSSLLRPHLEIYTLCPSMSSHTHTHYRQSSHSTPLPRNSRVTHRSAEDSQVCQMDRRQFLDTRSMVRRLVELELPKTSCTTSRGGIRPGKRPWDSSRSQTTGTRASPSIPPLANGP